jgi:hydrogenase maturation protein HypF
MWLALLQDLKNRVSAQKIASRFHLCVAHMISTVVARMSHEHTISSVALSGGVFQNPTLLTLVMNNLQEQGLEVLIHHQVPANDGGISLGQAAVAAVTMREKTRLCV